MKKADAAPQETKPTILKKEDPSKYSKLIMQHCRDKKYPIPDIGFLDLVDDVCNGQPIYESDEEMTQLQPEEEEFTYEIDTEDDSGVSQVRKRPRQE